MKPSKDLEELQEAYNQFLQDGDKSKMSSLLISLTKIPKEKSLDLYRNNYLSSLIESLSDTFSACKILFGDEMFQNISFEYCNTVSSRHPNLSRYGENFPSFIKDLTISNEIPFLSDLTQYEWILKETILGEYDCSEVSFEQIDIKGNHKLALKDHATLYQSCFPISEIWQSLISDSDKEIPEGDQFQYLIMKTDHGSKTIFISASFYNFLKNISSNLDCKDISTYSHELKSLNILKPIE